MGRKKKIKKSQKAAEIVSESVIEENVDKIKEVQFEFILDMAQEKYDYEIQREQELIQQSGQMQAAFSFMTAALFMALPIIMDNRGELSINFFLIVVSFIVFFLLLSLVLASVAAWRWKKKAFGNIEELKSGVIESHEWEKYLKRYNRLSAKINALEKIQVQREEINDKRASLIRASMVSFWCSIGSIVIGFVIAIYKLWY